MKKLSNKGFTLIELLAVITIMGILMMVAIPAVSRTIENSRRDTFADIAHEYVNAVRNAYIADNISCFSGQWNKKEGIPQERVASATSQGDYFFPICTDVVDECYPIYYDIQGMPAPAEGAAEGAAAGNDTQLLTADAIVTSTNDLMESGGKSPFGSSDMVGFVRIKKTVTERETTPSKRDGKFCLIHEGATDSECLKSDRDESKCKCTFAAEPTSEDITEGWSVWYKPLDNPKTTINYYVKMVDTGFHGISAPISESKVKRAAISTAVAETTKVSETETIPTLLNVDYDESNPGSLTPIKPDGTKVTGYKTTYKPCFIN